MEYKRTSHRSNGGETERGGGMIYSVIVFYFVLSLAWCKLEGYVSDITAIQIFNIVILFMIAGIKKDIESLKKEQSK